LDSASIDAEPDSSQASDGLDEFLARVGDLFAVGHRIVHGGPGLTQPAAVDDEVRAQLQAVTSLAPQHLPPALAALDRCRLPSVPHVACLGAAPSLRTARPSGRRAAAADHIRGNLDEGQHSDRLISTEGVPVMLIHPREDAQIALETRRTLRPSP
jgi:hypothetical protein